jgi:hypothetical protein
VLDTTTQLLKESRVIGVVSNDAGGAVQLTHFMRNLVNQPASYSLITGPAFNIWEDSQLPFGDPIGKNSLETILGKCDLILTSTGWMTDNEKNAVSIGRSLNIPVISVLDHWVGYRGRFGKLESDLPNFIAVNNSTAYKNALREFPSVAIFRFQDYQLESLRTNQNKNRSGVRNGLLIVLEPIVRTTLLPKDKSLINLWLDLIKVSMEIAKKNKLLLILREHPAENINQQILNLLLRDEDCDFILSRQTMEVNLSQAKYTIGLSSHLLYLSAELGIPTYSIFAGQNNHWTQDFSKIQPLVSLEFRTELQ